MTIQTDPPVALADVEVEAEYTLESPLICPSCNETLTRLHIVRMLRTRVNFTSTLSRRGYAVICPFCRKPVPAVIG